MSKELVIGSNRHETKVAILEEDQLVEVYFQRGKEYSLAGSIHKGRVTRVLPGMQSAFVDLGLERDTFLYVTDFFEENEDIDALPEEKTSAGMRGERRDRGPGRGRERSAEERQVEQKQAEPRLPEQRHVEQRMQPASAEPVETTAVAASAAPVELGATPEAAAGTAVERAGSRPPEPFRSGERSEGDRGPRGERRGRRSRRRRQRGRDFPDSKYAQPGAAASTQTHQSQINQPSIHVGEQQAEAAADVIVLPGESLAKYRSAPAHLAPTDLALVHEDLTHEHLTHEDLPFAAGEVAFEPESHEDLAAEAEELDLRDKIFSHRDDEPADEEKTEEAKIEMLEKEHAAPAADEPSFEEPAV
jgi:ribonuclease G